MTAWLHYLVVQRVQQFLISKTPKCFSCCLAIHIYSMYIYQGKNVSAKLHFKQGSTCEMYKNKTEVKIREKTIPKYGMIAKNEDQKTSLCWLYVQLMLCIFLIIIFHHHSVVEQSSCMFSSLPCFFTFQRSFPTSNEVLQKLFPLVSLVLVGEVCKLTSTQNQEHS